MRWLLLGALVGATAVTAGCDTAAFDLPWRTEPAATAAGAYEKTGADREAREQAIADCVASAEAQIARDRRIDRETEVGGQSGAGSAQGQEIVLRQRMEAYGYNKRRRRLIERCMAEKGYTRAGS